MKDQNKEIQSKLHNCRSQNIFIVDIDEDDTGAIDWDKLLLSNAKIPEENNKKYGTSLLIILFNFRKSKFSSKYSHY